MDIWTVIGYIILALYIVFIVAVILARAWWHVPTLLIFFWLYKEFERSQKEKEENS